MVKSIQDTLTLMLRDSLGATFFRMLEVTILPKNSWDTKMYLLRSVNSHAKY
jgi:hypothetical protein